MILEEMDYLLADPAFKHSRRCTLLLRGLVERALVGNFEGIKERILGVEVFGRNPSYDTNADPIVRMTANEIRKRLAQFYNQPNHHRTLEVSLFPGSYLLDFEFEPPEKLPRNEQLEDVPSEPQSFAETPAAMLETDPGDSVAEIASIGNSESLASPEILHISEPSASGKAKQPFSVLRRKWAGYACMLLALFAIGAVLVTSSLFRSTQYLFWKPLLKSKSIFICISDDYPIQREKTGAQGQDASDAIDSRKTPLTTDSTRSVNFPWFEEVNAAHRVSVLLAEAKHPTTLRPSSQLGFWSFRQSPAILIDSADNRWSSIFLSNLRFSVRVDPEAHTLWIQDAQNPSKREWTSNGFAQTDYAVITRFISPETGNWIVAISGLSSNGTDAASKVLTEPSFDFLLPRKVRSAKNFQIVMKANEISGVTAQPQILAFYSW
jgi:hypothetical protein